VNVLFGGMTCGHLLIKLGDEAMFPFPEMSLVLNSDNIKFDPQFESVSNGTNSWDSSTYDPNNPFTITPIDIIPYPSPTITPIVIDPPPQLYPETPIIYPPLPLTGGWPGLPGPIGLPLPNVDPDVEIVVLPKDPVEKRNALRKLLNDKVDEPEEGKSRRIDLGGEEECDG
jgi:hypothetical protein